MLLKLCTFIVSSNDIWLRGFLQLCFTVLKPRLSEIRVLQGVYDYAIKDSKLSIILQCINWGKKSGKFTEKLKRPLSEFGMLKTWLQKY